MLRLYIRVYITLQTVIQTRVQSGRDQEEDFHVGDS